MVREGHWHTDRGDTPHFDNGKGGGHRHTDALRQVFPISLILSLFKTHTLTNRLESDDTGTTDKERQVVCYTEEEDTHHESISDDSTSESRRRQVLWKSWDPFLLTTGGWQVDHAGLGSLTGRSYWERHRREAHFEPTNGDDIPHIISDSPHTFNQSRPVPATIGTLLSTLLQTSFSTFLGTSFSCMDKVDQLFYGGRVRESLVFDDDHTVYTQ